MHIPFNSISSRFTLIDDKGFVIYDSDEHNRESSLDNHLNRDEIKEAFISGTGFSIRKSDTQNVKKAYYASSFSDIAGNKFYFRVSQNFYRTESELSKILILNLIFFFILNFSIHTLYKDYLKKDLIEKLYKIKSFLELGTNLKEKSPYFKGDKWLREFWKVAENWQSENLKTLKALNNEKALLNTVIFSVDMSITLIDKNFKIILKNSSLNYLFEEKIIDIFSSIKNIEVLNVIKNFSSENLDTVTSEIYLNEYKKFFLITIKHLPEQNQSLLLIKDITLIRELVEIQKKFISNVSHELKTPLTNIKGYLIALEDAPEELKANFFSTIHNNIDKLENNIMDFLAISKLENSNILNLEDINWNRIKTDLNESILSLLNKKNGKLNFIIHHPAEPFIKTDYDKFKLIMKNLVENGFIYNNSQNPEVTVSITESLTKYLIIISDNGIGIDDTQLDKVFERFYRVDEARTTNLSGTGLGLSIVKESIDRLHGDLKVSSQLNLGTTFTISLPKN